jgi:hypothetical protein
MFRDDSNPGLERDVKMELIRARTGNPQGEHFTELATSPASQLIVSAVGVACQLYAGYRRSGKAIDVEAIAGLIGSALDRRQREPAIDPKTVQQVSIKAAELLIQGDKAAAPEIVDIAQLAFEKLTSRIVRFCVIELSGSTKERTVESCRVNAMCRCKCVATIILAIKSSAVRFLIALVGVRLSKTASGMDETSWFAEARSSGRRWAKRYLAVAARRASAEFRLGATRPRNEKNIGLC